jgi:hypothetical protein
MSVLPSDYDRDPQRFLASGKYPHDDVHPYVAARFGQAAARRVLDVGGGAATWPACCQGARQFRGGSGLWLAASLV